MAVHQKSQEYSYLIRITDAQNSMLDILVEKTGRTKAALMREAVNYLIGIYKPVLGEVVNDIQPNG